MALEVLFKCVNYGKDCNKCCCCCFRTGHKVVMRKGNKPLSSQSRTTHTIRQVAPASSPHTFIQDDINNETRHATGDTPPGNHGYMEDSLEETVGTLADVPSKIHNVTFDEDQNVTVNITPRGQRPFSGKKPRPYSGRRDLRHVKSRTDSGLSLAGRSDAKSQGKNLEFTCSESKENKKQVSEQNSSPERVRTLISNRSVPRQTKLSTVTMNYFDDSGDLPDVGESWNARNNQMQGKKRLSRQRPKAEIESQMSRCSLSDDDSATAVRKGVSDNIDSRPPEFDIGKNHGIEDPENQRPPSSAGLYTKCLSNPEKNYYEVAIDPEKGNQPPEVPHIKPIIKTTKTIELVEGGVSETKNLSVVDGPTYKPRKEYSPTRNGPQSKPRRPHSAKVMSC